MRVHLVYSLGIAVIAVGAARSTSAPNQGSASPSVVRQAPAPELRNPFEGNQRAIADGAKLFVSLNCADCHGGGGSGLVGPSFQDNRWRYGGSAGDVYRSIAEGRPEGMPTWNRYLAPNEIWKLVTYVRTLGDGKDVTTQSFTGKGVERTGH